jgi:OH-DDVA meta-cleavage compound hydrolase
MVIDCHGHTSAPQRLWAYRALLPANRGVDGPSFLDITDDEIRQAMAIPETGPVGHLPSLDAHVLQLQLLSPRPNHLMASERPERIIHWFLEELHNLIARQVASPAVSAAWPRCRNAPASRSRTRCPNSSAASGGSALSAAC